MIIELLEFGYNYNRQAIIGGNMPNLRRLFKIPVLLIDKGVKIGIVEDCVIDTNKDIIKAFLLNKPIDNSKSNLFGILFENVFSIGDDAIMIRHEKFLQDLSPFFRHDHYYFGSNLFEKNIYTETGFGLGTLSDIVFNEQTGEMISYEVSDGLISDILYGRIYFAVPKAQVIGENMLIVPERTNEPGNTYHKY
ncbi:PRC-barrel domain-containing protein [Selenomonadales bacterium OttesenSCG-928-I06]|nr:PRC-barrel domain-containing protein [Selenomonadales bacterium OttesenSCG-928-I06]